MENSLLEFEKRQQAVYRKHARMAQGYVNRFDKDSCIIVQEPDNKASGHAFKALMLVIPGFILFKAFVLAWLGTDAYQSHVVDLAHGSSFEQAGAWFMQVDPLSMKLAQFLASVIGS
jgi:hypothetical protein